MKESCTIVIYFSRFLLNTSMPLFFFAFPPNTRLHKLPFSCNLMLDRSSAPITTRNNAKQPLYCNKLPVVPRSKRNTTLFNSAPSKCSHTGAELLQRVNTKSNVKQQQCCKKLFVVLSSNTTTKGRGKASFTCSLIGAKRKRFVNGGNIAPPLSWRNR